VYLTNGATSMTGTVVCMRKAGLETLPALDRDVNRFPLLG